MMFSVRHLHVGRNYIQSILCIQWCYDRIFYNEIVLSSCLVYFFTQNSYFSQLRTIFSRFKLSKHVPLRCFEYNFIVYFIHRVLYFSSPVSMNLLVYQENLQSLTLFTLAFKNHHTYYQLVNHLCKISMIDIFQQHQLRIVIFCYIN